MPRAGDLADRHRAIYTLERSVWKARCRLCGCEVTDPVRRQAAALFRQHIKSARDIGLVAAPMVIDLREGAQLTKTEPA